MTETESNLCRQRFQKNLQFLPPPLRDCVLQADEAEMRKRIEVTFSSEGLPVCRYRQGEKCFRITGEHPVREAKTWADSCTLDRTGAVFVFGCGFGYPLVEIMARTQPETFVVVFEHDVYLFRAMLYFFDLEPLARTNRIAFIIGGGAFFANAFENLFYSTKSLGCTYPAVLFTCAARRNFKEEYLKIHTYVFEQLSLLTFHIGNDHLDNLVGLRNMLKNTKEILQSPGLSCLKDQYRGFPAFIVANGPSLDRNIRELKKIRGRGLILSVESAIKPLMKNGIKPDILTVVERTKGTYTCHFQNANYPGDIALLCLAVVDPRVLPSFKGEKIPIFRKSEALNEWINRYLGDGSCLNAGANVSHLALEIAAYLGADPIVFVGQDFAFGPDGGTHSKDSVYYEAKGKKTRDLIHSRPVVYVEGNDGTMIPSYQLWVDFRLGLERKIAVHAGRTFLNATEGGARIEGTVCVPLSQAVKQYCGRPMPERINEKIAACRKIIGPDDRQKRLAEFSASVWQYAASLRRLAREAAEKKQVCGRMIRLCENGEYERDGKRVKSICLQNMKSLRDFFEDALHRSFCQQIFFANYYYLNRIGRLDSMKKMEDAFRVQYHFFYQLNIVCQSASVHLEDAAAAMEELRSDLEENGGGIF